MIARNKSVILKNKTVKVGNSALTIVLYKQYR
jgi:hypothetical protein